MIAIVTREHIVSALTNVKTRICGYFDNRYKGLDARCDCKYGASFEGEQTGCPEVSLAAEVFQNMTEEEYHRILRRRDRVKKIKAMHAENERCRKRYV